MAHRLWIVTVVYLLLPCAIFAGESSMSDSVAEEAHEKTPSSLRQASAHGNRIFVIDSSDEEGSRSRLDKISGNFETPALREDQVYKSKNHYAGGPFGREKAELSKE